SRHMADSLLHCPRVALHPSSFGSHFHHHAHCCHKQLQHHHYCDHCDHHHRSPSLTDHCLSTRMFVGHFRSDSEAAPPLCPSPSRCSLYNYFSSSQLIIIKIDNNNK